MNRKQRRRSTPQKRGDTSAKHEPRYITMNVLTQATKTIRQRRYLVIDGDPEAMGIDLWVEPVSGEPIKSGVSGNEWLPTKDWRPPAAPHSIDPETGAYLTYPNISKLWDDGILQRRIAARLCAEQPDDPPPGNVA